MKKSIKLGTSELSVYVIDNTTYIALYDGKDLIEIKFAKELNEIVSNMILSAREKQIDKWG